jgi:hypothetical protein
LLNEYVEYNRQLALSTAALEGENGLIAVVDKKKAELEGIEDKRQELIDYKAGINQKFYEVYSRFIQEGTWVSEDYMDDDKYYTDALSVLYNSCYPQVAYTINTIAVQKLPGYENFIFNLGDTTYAEDPDFFGEEGRAEVIITEISEHLDDASKNTIKV